jgi:predicted component of type VI protein secretion system
VATRRVRYGYVNLVLDVRADETTAGRVAKLFGIAPSRLVLISSGVRLSNETEAAAASLILALGTPDAAQLPRKQLFTRLFLVLSGVVEAVWERAAPLLTRVLHSASVLLRGVWLFLASAIFTGNAPVLVNEHAD